MPVTFTAQGAICKGQATLLLAADLALPRGVARIRSAVRELAAAGFNGVRLAAAAADAAVVAKDTARRAGIGVLAPPGLLPSEPHVLTDASQVHEVGDVAAAWAALFAGHLLLAGPAAALAPLVALASQTADVAGWQPQPAPPGWALRGAGDELAGYAPAGGALPLPPPGPRWLLLIDPFDGAVAGASRPAPDEPLLLRCPPDEPALFLLTPRQPPLSVG
ncbi:MAG: hypothetical protein IT204_25420 [Fimbriimonadaceae bacterium]|nr:hypothetical protein [Fimbriimonadaceae bacterium]